MNSHGHLLRRSTQYGDTYAPEGMGPRSGVHDGKGARKGHSCQRTHSVSPPNDTQGRRVFAWSGSQKVLAKSSSQKGGVGTVGKVTRRDDLSGLLVAVLDNQPTDKRTHLSTRGLGLARALPASGRKVINHSSPLPVACRHAAPPSWPPFVGSVKGASLCRTVRMR